MNDDRDNYGSLQGRSHLDCLFVLLGAPQAQFKVPSLLQAGRAANKSALLISIHQNDDHDNDERTQKQLVAGIQCRTVTGTTREGRCEDICDIPA